MIKSPRAGVAEHQPIHELFPPQRIADRIMCLENVPGLQHSSSITKASFGIWPCCIMLVAGSCCYCCRLRQVHDPGQQFVALSASSYLHHIADHCQDENHHASKRRHATGGAEAKTPAWCHSPCRSLAWWCWGRKPYLFNSQLSNFFSNSLPALNLHFQFQACQPHTRPVNSKWLMLIKHSRKLRYIATGATKWPRGAWRWHYLARFQAYLKVGVLGISFCDFCFPASLIFFILLFCFSPFFAFIVLCFSTFPLFCCFASPLCCLSASPLCCFHAFLLFQLLCFSAFCFFAFLLFQFLCCCAYLLSCFSAFPFVLFLILQIILKNNHVNKA